MKDTKRSGMLVETIPTLVMNGEETVKVLFTKWAGDIGSLYENPDGSWSRDEAWTMVEGAKTNLNGRRADYVAFELPTGCVGMKVGPVNNILTIRVLQPGLEPEPMEPCSHAPIGRS